MPVAVLSADSGGTATAGPLAPPLKWAGGKRWLVPHLRPLWQAHQHRRLVEPFCGGLAVALGLRPGGRCSTTSTRTSSTSTTGSSAASSIDVAMANDRELLLPAPRALQRADRGGQRRDAGGGVALLLPQPHRLQRALPLQPQGRLQRALRPLRDDQLRTRLRRLPRRCRRLAVHARRLRALPLRPDDFVYADPPYDVEFTPVQHGRLLLGRAGARGRVAGAHPGPVVLVEPGDAAIVELYEPLGFALRFATAPRRISCNGDRTRAREVLATRNLQSSPGSAPGWGQDATARGSVRGGTRGQRRRDVLLHRRLDRRDVDQRRTEPREDVADVLRAPQAGVLRQCSADAWSAVRARACAAASCVFS